MKNSIKKTLVIAAMIFAGLGVNVAQAAQDAQPACGYKIAVVDVNTVVSKSAQVKALKAEQEQKLADLRQWLKTVREDVKKQQSQEGKEKLIKKYDAEFAKKQDEIKSNYAKKLKDIDKSISATIAEQAKAKGYNIVFAKGTVLFGGDDITKDVAKVVK